MSKWLIIGIVIGAAVTAWGLVWGEYLGIMIGTFGIGYFIGRIRTPEEDEV